MSQHTRGSLVMNMQIHFLKTQPVFQKLITLDPRCIHTFKIILLSKLLEKWQNHWDYSEKRTYTQDLGLKLSLDLLSLSPVTTTFLRGHGSFREHRHKFDFSSSSACEVAFSKSLSLLFLHIYLTLAYFWCPLSI